MLPPSNSSGRCARLAPAAGPDETATRVGSDPRSDSLLQTDRLNPSIRGRAELISRGNPTGSGRMVSPTAGTGDTRGRLYGQVETFRMAPLLSRDSSKRAHLNLVVAAEPELPQSIG